MVKYAIVGLAGALVGGLSTWALLPEPPPALDADEHETPTGPRAPRAPRAPRRGQGPETLPECERALEEREAQLAEVRATAARALGERGAASPDASRHRAGEPTVREPGDGDGAPSSATAAALPADQAAADRAAADRIDEALLAELGVTDEERQITKQVMCSQQANQRALVLDFSEGRVDAETLFRSLAQERSTANDGMRRSLGAARFRELRSAGGMGILTRALCNRP